ncbi:MAG: caspase family protein [Leptospirales bacterium]
MIKKLVVIILPIMLITSSTTVTPQSKNKGIEKIYYLIVGNSYYDQNMLFEDTPFENLQGAKRSAELIETYIKENSKSEGIILLSKKNNLLKRETFFTALENIIKKIENDKANSLLIVYFCGHGVTDGIGWNLFLIPGAFRGNKKELTTSIETFAQKAIYVMDIYKVLEKVKFPHIVMLDTCYEGEESKLTPMIFSEALQENLTNISNIVRYMNQFHTDSAFLFSTKPGSYVPMVENPKYPSSVYNVGPLARRFALVFEKFKRSRVNMTYGDLIRHMISNDLDSKTKPALTYVEKSFFNMNIFTFD